MKPLAAIAALALGALAGAGASAAERISAKSPAAALAERWAGLYDIAEQRIFGGEDESEIGAASGEQRVHILVEPVSLPWLGEHVLYFEEFLHEEPERPRRLMLLRLETEAGARPAVRVRQFTFREPGRWRRLYRSPARIEALRREDLQAVPSCDLRMVREGEQFRGGTARRSCIAGGEPGRYVDYRLMIGKSLYWYDLRVLDFEDDGLLEETIAFDWFELHEARLFTCRVLWAPKGSADAPRPLTSLDVHDQGGRARFTAPDGRPYELELHSEDWPFDANRDALILIVQEEGADEPLASSWTGRDDDQISVDLGWLRVSCGPYVPSGGSVRA